MHGKPCQECGGISHDDVEDRIGKGIDKDRKERHDQNKAGAASGVKSGVFGYIFGCELIAVFVSVYRFVPEKLF